MTPITSMYVHKWTHSRYSAHGLLWKRTLQGKTVKQLLLQAYTAIRYAMLELGYWKRLKLDTYNLFLLVYNNSAEKPSAAIITTTNMDPFRWFYDIIR